jgi:hypothetical protein
MDLLSRLTQKIRKKLLILPLGEFHELPELKKKKIQDRYNIFLNTHRNIESSLRVFKIDFTHLEEPLKKLVEAAGGTIENVSHVSYGFEVGSTRTAEIIDKDKLIVKIV